MSNDEYIEKLNEVIILLDDLADEGMSLIYQYEYCHIKDAINLLALAKENFENRNEILEE